MSVARAETREETMRESVLNAHVDLHWLEGGTQAWYRRQTGSGHREFILIDAIAATRGMMFDHRRLASSLAAVLGTPVDPRMLPIADIVLCDEGHTLVVLAGGRWWEGPLSTLELAPSHRGHQATIERAPRPTVRTGDGSTLTVVNRTKSEIDLFWLDFNGKSKKYGSIRPGGEQHEATYGGHVWMATDQAGGIVGVIEAGDSDRYVELDGTLPPDAQASTDRDLSPDGRWRASLRDHNLWLRPTGGGAEIALTQDGTADDHYGHPIAWSPDSAHLAAFRTREGDHRTITLIESSPADQVQPRQRVVPYPKPGDRIDAPRPCLFSVPDRRQIPVDCSLLDNPWSIDELSWNADGRAFTVLFNQRGHQRMRVVEIDRAGHARALVDEHATTFIDYAGKSYYRRLPATHEILWMSERDGWNHLYRYDAETGMVKNQITHGPWVVRSVDMVDEHAGLIWFSAGGLVPGQDPYFIQHARIAFDGSGLTVLTAGDGDHQVAWSPDRRWFVDSWSRVDQPPQCVLRDGRSGTEIIELERADISALVAQGWERPERFVAKGRDGTTDIYGVLWRPRGFSPDRHYPVVECIYAGPQAAYVPTSFHATYAQQAIADLGFVVGMVDGMGTSYRSKAFHDVCWKNLADAGFPDRIPWWKSAAATRPYLDLTRVGIYGGSAGGQNALGALLWHPEFYKVAVADCGCHDNRMDKIWWNELWMGWPVGPHYAEQSNVTNAAKLQGRLMLIVGELDDNVDPASTFQVAHALEQAGKDFELVVVQGTGHGAAETPFGSRKRADFLVRNLVHQDP